MIVDLVEEAVEIKIHFENFTGMLQSDYEFCYAIGKMHKILNLALEKELTIEEQKEKIEEKMGNYEPKDYIEKNLNLSYHEGTYAFMPGPSYETPAEIRALKVMGADVVGMSTVPEAITANYCGMNVYAFAAISNYAAGVTNQTLNHEEVIENGKVVADSFAKIIAKLLNLMKVY